MFAAGPGDQGRSVGTLAVPPKQPVRFQVSGDLGASECTRDDVIGKTVSYVASRAPPASEAMMSICRDRLAAAARVGSDEGGSQAQAHRDAHFVISQSKPE